jgi:hypothetical protein
MVILGIAALVLVLLGTPILLIYLYPSHLDTIIVGWIAVFVVLIGGLFYHLFRKGGHGHGR